MSFWRSVTRDQLFIPNNKDAFIATYADNFKPNTGGGIFYRQTISPELLRKADSIIRSVNFRAKNLVIITYNNLTSAGMSETHENTFQTVIAYDDVNTRLILYYDHLYTQNALAGYNFPNCTGKKFHRSKYSSEMALTTNKKNIGQHVISLNWRKCSYSR